MAKNKCVIYCKGCKKRVYHKVRLQIGGTQKAHTCLNCGREFYENVKMSKDEREKREQKWLKKLWNIQNNNIII